MMSLRRGGAFGLSSFLCTILLVCLYPNEGCKAADVEAKDAGYILTAEDTILIRVPDAAEFSSEKSSYRIDSEGALNLPLVGRLQAAGRTARQLESELNEALKSYYLEPRVAVSVVEFHSEPVSVLGAVTTPGIQRVNSDETLLEVLSRAGGLRPDAGETLVISRRMQYGKLPLPEAVDDPSGGSSVAVLKISALTTGARTSANIVLKPHDVVTVMRAEMVYVLGEVIRAGGFVLPERGEMSALKALALAGGLSRTAAPGKARILRREAGAQQRQEVPVNLSQIVKNKEQDPELRPEDILFIPSDLTKRIATRSIEAMVGIGSNIAIWRATQ